LQGGSNGSRGAEPPLSPPHFNHCVNENADENEIPFTAENENEHSFSAEKKRKSPDNISIFYSFSYIQSPSQPYNMRRQYLVQFRLFAGGPC